MLERALDTLNMEKCDTCGKINKQRNLFCKRCGKRLEEVKTSTPEDGLTDDS